jgi:small subunit ribosomal protein S24
MNKTSSGKYKITPQRNRPLTYEMANPPHYIGHRKSWNSWNTANAYLDRVPTAQREAQTITEDMFIRKFITSTFHAITLSEVIIKRQFNHIRIAFLMHRGISPRKAYFLIGYTEELLSYWLQCPVTLEIQSVEDKRDVIFKYI